MAKLPRLPAPDLRKTLDRYGPPTCNEARGRSLFDVSYAKRVQWADDLEKGIGRICQRKLHELDTCSPHNWLDDNIWTTYAYLSWRASLLINSNWWLHSLMIPPYPNPFCIEPWQVRRAACILHRVLDWRARMPNQHPDPDTTRTGDVTLMLCDFVYTVRVCEDDRTPLPVQTTESHIRAVALDVINRIEAGESAVPIGVLTSDDRPLDRELSTPALPFTHNASTLRAVDESIMALSFDHYTAMPWDYPTPTSLSSSQSSRASVPALDSDAEFHAHLHNIRSPPQARNIWFDKCLTLSQERNTRTGAMGEQTPVDALVPSIVFEYSVAAGIDTSTFSEPVPLPLTLEETRLRDDGEKGWTHLDWVTDKRIESQVREAEGRAQALIDNSEAGDLEFGEHGADWISNARLPPDAYTQLAIQLAWYRSRGILTATYETALTRMFNAGRTECVRSVSVEGLDFVQAAKEWERGAGCRAIQTHRRTREAATGRGIDKHLLGLKLMLEGLATHPLFTDPLFSRSQEWKLSTSGLSAGYNFRGTGFGSPWEDGYGINYLIAPNRITFCVESRFSSPLTSANKFKEYIADTILDMWAIYEAGELELTGGKNESVGGVETRAQARL
ncbi:Choline/Carnitine o-acyltransferase-domain-containing protein [Suillus paluster]|uniref:Choline/Carnitine o-acyltransferase-domain-containing protein n=1 Tax=Suillus paluster TaxID=48578 RepID=UPI001B874BB8|nr:Choline/Carnitine o-acyltransferase-domain-containing protein [Suillus paluster]KAG1747233.1 Choline/Carnitine o-acyltransferase-domain-containing protein [Suillus paluster]